MLQWKLKEKEVGLNFRGTQIEIKRVVGHSENRVNPGETNTTAIATIRRTDSIEGLLIGQRKMKVYFIDATMYDQIPIGDPLPDELLLDSRVYDLEALRAINFNINYPLD